MPLNLKTISMNGSVFKYLLVLCCLCIVGYVGSIRQFSLPLISGPLFAPSVPPVSSSVKLALAQPYSYLGQGRQAFAFISQDGKWVVKFFNQRYHQMPFYGVFSRKERLKRQKRERFYVESYHLAMEHLAKETGMLYVHFGPSSDPLPILDLKDRKGRSYRIDLNSVPFVLQKKGEPFYSAIETLPLKEGIVQFVDLIANRIAMGIADSDHNVESNFAICEGKVIQIDPGRYHLLNMERKKTVQQEWWSATHRFRNWLEKNHPESVRFFDQEIERKCTVSILQKIFIDQSLAGATNP